MDFTLNRYKELLNGFWAAGYKFITYSDYIKFPHPEKFVILRHDVDDRKENSLDFAHIQQQYGIRGSYYFRTITQSFDLTTTRQVADLGHEVGYHYETMDWAKGDVDYAYHLFCENLDELRKNFTIQTICMHGSPLSKWDNRAIWQKYNYKALDILGEPYFDTNFDEVFYLTDTGRRWDGDKVSIRDKVVTSEQSFDQLFFHSTNDIVTKLRSDSLPNRIMMTFHPQRWTNNLGLWTQELLMQTMKNWVKGYMVKQHL